MTRIDADAHVDETGGDTWAYLEGSDERFTPDCIDDDEGGDKLLRSPTG